MEFHKDNVFVELSDEERETLNKAERIVEDIWKGMTSDASLLDLQREDLSYHSYSDHDIIKVYRFLRDLALNDKNKLEYGNCYSRWAEIAKYEENRR